ncbi:MAG: VacB/RNase II family 3'-5' exoribonuclease [Chlamydiales bacterium]|nr:VacB/RNase II family 3'-5' exoribonuclease [Chlamydiales bacterium]
MKILGIIHTHPRGFGFVTPDNPDECSGTVFIPAQYTEGAVQGDHVEIELADKPMKPERGPEGKVLRVLERGRSQITGVIVDKADKNQFILYSPLLGPEKDIFVTGKKLAIGQRVTVKITNWDDLTGKVETILGTMDDPKLDVKCAILEYELDPTFSPKAVEEAKSFGKTVDNIKDRVDFTNWEIITIDPETARDFDDALSLTIDEKKHFHLGVHIADVSHYVRPGTTLDAIASKRCNSTYFPGTCLPMIPEELSNELCSLKEGVVRLTSTVLMEFTPDGTLINYEIVKGAIKSQKRFTYEEAKRVLDGEETSQHQPLLKNMVTLCELLKGKRRERGSVDLSLPETVMKVDKAGKPIGFRVVQYDITHQLVEEFMLKANEMVATHLSKTVPSSVYRVHQAPTAEDQKSFFDLARLLGFKLSKEPTVQEIQELFEKAKTTPHAQQLSISFIKSMKLAMYSPDNVGHFGLSLEHYTHFTSPIRRYPDLVIHRLLFEKPDPKTSLEKICLCCSDAERASSKAENRVLHLKKLRYLLELEETSKTEPIYDASITNILHFGFTFDITDFGMEGLIRLAELPHYYNYDAKRQLLQTDSGHKRLCLGDKIKVKVDGINLPAAEVFWKLI